MKKSQLIELITAKVAASIFEQDEKAPDIVLKIRDFLEKRVHIIHAPVKSYRMGEWYINIYHKAPVSSQILTAIFKMHKNITLYSDSDQLVMSIRVD